jgi:hypothetical protein
MSKKIRVILFVCIAANIFLVVYDRNFSGKDEMESQQQKAELNQNGNVVGKQTNKKKTAAGVSKDQTKLTAKLFKHVKQAKSQFVADPYDQAAGTGNQQSMTDEKKPISLWEQDESDLGQGESENSAEDTTVEHEESITTNPEVFENLQVGQVLDFFVPQLGESFQSEVTSTSNQFGDVKVWKGDVQGEEQDKSNFIMTQGEKMTNVVLSTNEGIYTVNIDNETGQGTVVDNREYSSRMSDVDDAVPYYYDEPQSE